MNSSAMWWGRARRLRLLGDVGPLLPLAGRPRDTRRTRGACSAPPRRPPTRIPLMTYVTCPTTRYHPAVVAQKAATMQLLSQGRFRLGLGSGENLNEHVVGGGWPAAHVRLEMLEEAVEIIRSLFAGGNVNHHGAHFDVENARLWDLPDTPPPIGVAVSGERSCEVAGHLADLLIATEPKADLTHAFDRHGGAGKPEVGPAARLLRHGPGRGDRPRPRPVPLVRRRLAGQRRTARTRSFAARHPVRTARGRGRVHSVRRRLGRRSSRQYGPTSKRGSPRSPSSRSAGTSRTVPGMGRAEAASRPARTVRGRGHPR